MAVMPPGGVPALDLTTGRDAHLPSLADPEPPARGCTRGPGRCRIPARDAYSSANPVHFQRP